VEYFVFAVWKSTGKYSYLLFGSENMFVLYIPVFTRPQY